jgi:serine/threonine protein kinase
MELLDLGYVHRDVKPENVVLSADFAKVKLIDFNRAMPIQQFTKGTVRGTDGYYPDWTKELDGSSKWDCWSVGAMILEADLETNEYININSAHGAKGKA